MIFEDVIEILMDDALSARDDKYREMVKELHTVRSIFVPQREEEYVLHSEESALLDLLWKRACVLTGFSGSTDTWVRITIVH